MIQPYSTSFSSISAISEIKQPPERGWSTRAAMQRQKRQNGRFTEEHTSECVMTQHAKHALTFITDSVSGVFQWGGGEGVTAGRQALWHVRDKLHPGGGITEDLDHSEREGEKRALAGEAWRSARFCGASGERSFILPCSGECGDH